jgi:hypothetical protein
MGVDMFAKATQSGQSRSNSPGYLVIRYRASFGYSTQGPDELTMTSLLFPIYFGGRPANNLASLQQTIARTSRLLQAQKEPKEAPPKKFRGKKALALEA